MILPAIVKISFVKGLLDALVEEHFIPFLQEITSFGESVNRVKLNKLITLKNEETNKVARQLVNLGTLEGCSIEQIYALFRRVDSAYFFIEQYNRDHVLFLLTEDKAFEDPIEFFLLNLEYSHGSKVSLNVVPSDEVNDVLKKAFPGWTPVTD